MTYAPQPSLFHLEITVKLLVGLGNPEKRYDGSRHNVGFALLDVFAKEQGVGWKESAKFKAFVAELPSKDLLVKPTTYYNLSGEAVRAVADFYKVTPENILVIHDDHVLPFGTLRTRSGGSDAGNNGVKSINSHMPGTNRLRVGTHTELREKASDVDYVLSKFSADEKQALALLQKDCNKIITEFLNGTFTATTYQLDTDR